MQMIQSSHLICRKTIFCIRRDTEDILPYLCLYQYHSFPFDLSHRPIIFFRIRKISRQVRTDLPVVSELVVAGGVAQGDVGGKCNRLLMTLLQLLIRDSHD